MNFGVREHGGMDAPTLARTQYPSEASDAAWAFVAPSLTLMDEGAPQRRHTQSRHLKINKPASPVYERAGLTNNAGNTVRVTVPGG